MVEMERKFKGIWIPAEIWLSDEINMQQKAMLGEIDSYKVYFASNAHLAEKMSLSVPRVKALLSDLRSKDWIKQKETRKGQLTVKRTIWINKAKLLGIENDTNPLDGIENNTKLVLKTIRGGIENDTHTNKVTNKEENKDYISKEIVEHFNYFWRNGLNNGSKKKALEQFKKLVKKSGKSSKEWAGDLLADCEARVRAGQYGFDKLHTERYLRDERWTDEIKINQPIQPRYAAKPAKPSFLNDNLNESF